MSSLREAAITFFQALDRLGIIYAIGGSVASSLHGVARATQDIDVVIDLRADQITDFCEALAPQFYLDEEAIVGAVREGRSFNLIHFESGLKIDLFVASRHPLGSNQLAHRQLEAQRARMRADKGEEHAKSLVGELETETVLRVFLKSNGTVWRRTDQSERNFGRGYLTC